MTEPDVSSLLTVAQAIAIIDSMPVAPLVVRRPLQEAAGLRLAHDLLTDRDYPPFPRSLMDGYAVRREDVRSTPCRLRFAGEIAAGQWPDHALQTGEAMAIMTGAPIPEGADGVVPVEQASRPADGQVEIDSASDIARHIAPRGSDARAGQLALRAGAALGPAQLAVAGTIGAAEVDVFAPPRVAVLGTGDEVVPVSARPGPAQIRNSNTPMLVALCRSMGALVTDLGTCRDDPEALKAALSRGLMHDVLVVSGGMSMGAHDHVPRLLQELGVTLRITKLRIKPGKPFVFGQKEAAFVFGLPGNPVSAFVCMHRLASRLLARLGGGGCTEKWVSGVLERGLPANGPREFYQPAFRQVPRGSTSARSEFAPIAPLTWKGSADLFTLAAANVLLVRAENEPPLAKGTLVRVLEI